MTQLSHIAETPRHGFSANNKYAEAIDYLTSGANASLSERLVVRTMLDSFKAFSHWTMEHSVRQGLQVRELSSILGYSEHDASRFGFCACLHDAGKLSIPITMLEKPGKISEEERALIQTHVLTDFDCLDYFKPGNQELVKDIIRYHHENYDGTGYPDRLLKDDIPEIAQIGRICDFFDAIHSDRPYRKGLTQTDAILLMRENAQAFNPALFEAFAANIDMITRKSTL